MLEQLQLYKRAGYPLAYIVSREEDRALAAIAALCQDEELRQYTWSFTRGLADCATGRVDEGLRDPQAVAQWAADQLPEGALLVLLDYHAFLESPTVWRALKDAASFVKPRGSMIVILGCRIVLPPEVQNRVALVEPGLPGKGQLLAVLQRISQDTIRLVKESGGKVTVGLHAPSDPQALQSLLEAATGLDELEAENAFSLSLVKEGRFDPAVIQEEKEATLRKGGILEVCRPDPSGMEGVGGLENLKAWLRQRGRAFSDEAREFGLPIPKGILLLGIPGTGKSLSAKATAAMWGRPLLRLDVGKVFGGLVGESEANIRQAIRTAEAVAPCVLWVDEVDKAFGGVKGYQGDSGTQLRVFGSFITWLQEKASPVFVVATANDLGNLPPELLRKGRFDEIFFVDLPSEKERQDILAIHLQKRSRDPREFDLPRLARESEGFSGAEIEQAVVSALYAAFDEGRRETTEDMSQAVRATVPLSKTMESEVAVLREWARQRARMAGGDGQATTTTGRRVKIGGEQ